MAVLGSLVTMRTRREDHGDALRHRFHHIFFIAVCGALRKWQMSRKSLIHNIIVKFSDPDPHYFKLQVRIDPDAGVENTYLMRTLTRDPTSLSKNPNNFCKCVLQNYPLRLCGSGSGMDPDSVGDPWIRIRIRIFNPDPDPRGQKWPGKKENSLKISCFGSKCWMFSFEDWSISWEREK